MTKLLPRWLSLPVVFAFLGIFSAAARADLEIPRDPNPPLVTYLENGLEVALKPMTTSKLVSCQLWVKAGSTTEEKYLGSGISHYLEHMLFKGTAARGVGVIAQEVENLGGSINAYTSYDRTVYSIELPAEHLEKALDILADAAAHSVFDPSEFEKEGKVILQEFSFSEDDPEKYITRMLWSNTFRVHPSRHPVIGYRPLFEKIARDDLLDYYKRYYIPNNMLLVVAGGVDLEQALSLAEKKFGGLERKSLPPSVNPEEPPQLGARFLEKTRQIEKAYFYLSFPGPKITSPDVAPIDVLAEILGGGKSSRLYRTVREGKNLAYSVDTWSYTGRDLGLFAVYATLAGENVGPLKAAIWEEIKKIQEEGVRDEELKIARASLMKTILTSWETASDQAGTLGSNLVVAGSADFDRHYLEQVSRVTADDVKRIARAYFSLQKENLTVLRPKAVEEAETVATAAPVTLNNIHKKVLPNGATLLTRSDPSLPLVSVRAVFKGGVLSESEKLSGVCHLMTQLFLKGSRDRSRDQFMEKLEALGGEISPYTGYNSFGCQIKLLGPYWREGLELLAEVIQKPRFEPADLESEKKIILAGIRAREDEPFDAAGKLLRETLYVKHPYRLQTYGTVESVTGLQKTDVEKYYRDYVRPQNMVIAVFGDIPEEKVAAEVEKIFENFKADKGPLFEDKKEPEQKETRKNEKMKETQQSIVALGFHTVSLFDADQYPLEIIGNLYSGQGSRLFKSVREEQGLAYTVGAYQVLGLDPGYFTFYAGTRPEKGGEVLDLIWKEIRLLKEKGITAEELERAKNGLIGERQRSLEQNSDLAFKVALDELYGLGWSDYRQYEKRIRGVTAEEVRRVAQKYFKEEAYALVEVKPKGDS